MKKALLSVCVIASLGGCTPYDAANLGNFLDNLVDVAAVAAGTTYALQPSRPTVTTTYCQRYASNQWTANYYCW